MKHYGDITKINGAEVPIVDIVTGGSPCQDLSVAGARKGLAGERSGLFMEQIRVIREMRDECKRELRMRGSDVDLRCVRPRYMVWENVPGAFSSNKGEDFRCVLEEIARVEDKTASIPMPEGGRWSTSGCIMGDGWSIAWRVHDAQFWGVPQRRKRIAVVADFAGESAPEILFERESVPRDSAENREQGQRVTATVERGTDKAISFQERAGCEGGARESSSKENEQEHSQPLTTNQCLNSWDVQSKHIQPQDGVADTLYSGEKSWGGGESYVMQGINGEVAGTLDANYYKGCEERQGTEREVICYGISGYESNSMKSPNPHSGIYEAETTRTLDLNGGNPACNQGGMMILENQEAVCCGNGQMQNITMKPSANALDTMHDQQAVMVLGIDRASFNQGQNAQFDFKVEEEVAQTLVSRGPGGVMTTR